MAANMTGNIDFDEGSESPREVLDKLIKEYNFSVFDKNLALFLDEKDAIKNLRHEFNIPKLKTIPGVNLSKVNPEEECLYFSGNSMGLQPKRLHFLTDSILQAWGELGKHAYWSGPMPSTKCEEFITEKMAKLVGAQMDEVTAMNALTVNLHLFMVSFYKPTQQRHKILTEYQPFSSDFFAIESQIRMRGFNPATSIIQVPLKPGEETLEMEDILEVIEKEGDSIALILFPGVQYYTGQAFDMEAIVKTGHKKGCYVGFDLAHALGNIELSLHKWGVDFACWCTYKYLNAGPGCLGGAFLHQKHASNKFDKLTGWWSHKYSTRFQISSKLDRTPGVGGYKISNTSPILAACVKAGLEVFDKTSMRQLRRKSFLLTGYLEFLLEHIIRDENGIRVITPKRFHERGAQLSVSFSCNLEKICDELNRRGIVCDVRLPNVLRITPVPLYNTFLDVFNFVLILNDLLKQKNI